MKGLVVRARSGHYDVRLEDGAVATAVPRQSLYRRADGAEPVAVGDRVAVAGDRASLCAIVGVERRRNWMSRSRPREGGKEQILAANLDRILVLASLREPVWKPGAVDRYLVLAESRGIPAALLFTKRDLAPDAPDEPDVRSYLRLPYPVLFTSTRSGEGREALLDLLAGGVSLLVGPSGSGKSSLVNWVRGGSLPTAPLSRATGKGVHTTTWVDLLPVERGGYVVDSPGIRSIGLHGVEARDLAACYPEFRALGPCRFRDCSHRSEPGCRVREALGGPVSAVRYENYLRIHESLSSPG